MIRDPHPEEIMPFEARSADEHAVWLWNGLFDYLFNQRGRHAFAGAEPFIEQMEGTLASDLGQLFLVLSHKAIDHVRTAVTDLFNKADFTNPRELEVASILLELGAHTKALGLPRIIARKRLTIPPTEPGRRLFAAAFDIAAQAGFREPTETLLCIRLLVEAPLFVEPWIGRALVGMTRAAPEEFAAHYDLLRERLDSVYHLQGSVWGGSTDVRAERVSVVRQVARALGKDRTGDLAYPMADGATDNWWLQSLEDPRLADIHNQLGQLIGRLDPKPEADAPEAGGVWICSRPSYDTVDEFFADQAVG